MGSDWPALDYEAWVATCDTLHSHAQVVGKLATRLAPPEPQLQHAALRLTARGWETRPLPAPDRSGAFVAALDLHAHEVAIEHSDGRGGHIPLTPNRPVRDVTLDVIAAVGALAGRVEIDPTPQETEWTTPLDEDTEHATYDTAQVADYLAAATRAALVLAEVRAPFRGRSTQLNAWWGGFDLAVNFFSGRPAEPPSTDFIMRNSMDAQDITIGWWPGYRRYPRCAFYAYAHPPPAGYGNAKLSPEAARWDEAQGLFLLDWDDVRSADDPHATAVGFARSVVRHACTVCDWDPRLAASFEGMPPPVT
jgi:hypothetical protein